MNGQSDAMELGKANSSLSLDWHSLLDAVGTRRFESVLGEFINRLIGPGAYIAFSNEERAGKGVLGSCSSVQSQIHVPQEQLHWIHFDGGIAVGLPAPLQWAHIQDLSRRIAGTGGPLAAVMLRHLECVNTERDSDPLRSISEIERCLADCSELTRREIEVCSRVLFGMSSAGIALDLHVCENTIKTYRKRAYQRLSIGSERELTTWYLKTWRKWRRQNLSLASFSAEVDKIHPRLDKKTFSSPAAALAADISQSRSGRGFPGGSGKARDSEANLSQSD